MDQLTCKELKVLCKGLNLSTSGLKKELIQRVSQHLNLPDCEREPEVPRPPLAENVHRRVVFASFRRRINKPIRWVTSWFFNLNDDDDDDNEDDQNFFAGCSIKFVMLLGILGGLHFISQIYLYFCADEMQIILPRQW